MKALHALLCPIVCSLLDQCNSRPHFKHPIRTPFTNHNFIFPFHHHLHKKNKKPTKRRGKKKILSRKKKNSLISSKESSDNMKMMSGSNLGSSKRRIASRGLGGALREQRAKLYIIRRCVVMLLCWHD
ncbi:uncharacterized protein LOC111387174 [Olea europaea var. sylvestris]|uniref:uncharacterized protein LOC111387174 n=1 Tax=Olea europaea var. sylvestris TaxID=158386 RepID=UPI000C1D8BE9|nr:uncharacterized protein LOC111387174 [Olea europaea var. sylvestris]